jgi:hypothetical protein
VGADRPPHRSGELIVGRLIAHGLAHYEFRPDQDPSYYLKLLTDRGERLLWGKGLERALAQAKTQPKTGDIVGARRLGSQPVSISKPGQAPQTKYRTDWEVEKAAFLVERARRARLVRDRQTDARETVRARPELKSTFLTLRSAAELAARRIANPKDRERFVSLVREAIAGSINRGEPLPDVRIREAANTGEQKPPPLPPRRDEPTR